MASVVEQVREIIGGDPEALGELEQLIDENGGEVETNQVLDAARDPESALHKHFEWDDSVAAEKYRLDQARTLIQAYRLHIVDERGERTTRYFANVIVEDRNVYKRTEEVLRVDALREQKRMRIVRDLNRLRGELVTFQEFSDALVSIDAALSALDKPAA